MINLFWINLLHIRAGTCTHSDLSRIHIIALETVCAVRCILNLNRLSLDLKNGAFRNTGHFVHSYYEVSLATKISTDCIFTCEIMIAVCEWPVHK